MKKITELKKEEEQRALDIHRKAIIIDGLDATWPRNLSSDYFQAQIDGGVTAFNNASSVEDNFLGAVKVMLEFYRHFERNKDKLLHATSVEDIREAKKSGKTAMITGLQNAKPIEDNIENLKILHRLGIRIIQLTYQKRNFLGDGCGERTNCGLSDFGLAAVKEMNNLGLLIDLSHVGAATTLDAIEASKDPTVFTHSNVRALCDNVRNHGDEQIKALAEKEGVMGISYHSKYIKPRGIVIGTTVEDYIDRIEYVAKLVGVDHVGIGLDYRADRTKEEIASWERSYPELAEKEPWDFINYTVADLRDIRNLSLITKGLVARGYSDEEIKKILGGNFLRVFERVWKP